MQLQGLLFMVFFLLVLPILALSTHQLIFFAVMAAIITFGAIQNIYNYFLSVGPDDDFEEEAAEDMEDLLDLNMRNFGVGMQIVKNLLLVLFFVYCSFYLNSILLKIAAVLLILIQIYNIRKALSENPEGGKEAASLDRNLAMASGVLSLVLIIFTSFNIVLSMNF